MYALCIAPSAAIALPKTFGFTNTHTRIDRPFGSSCPAAVPSVMMMMMIVCLCAIPADDDEMESFQLFRTLAKRCKDNCTIVLVEHCRCMIFMCCVVECEMDTRNNATKCANNAFNTKLP